MSFIIVPHELNPKGYEQITLTGAAEGLASVPSNFFEANDYAIEIDIETDDVRYRVDGTNPTASVGMRLTKDEHRVFGNINLTNIKFIKVTNDAKVNVHYYSSD